MSTPRPNLYCRRCRSQVSWPAEWDDGAKRELAARARQDRAGAVVRLGREAGLPLAEAKAVVMHLSREGGQCVRCSRRVTEGETVCASCGGVNLNW